MTHDGSPEPVTTTHSAEPRIHLPLRIHPAAVALLDREAARRGLSRSDVAREALTIGIRQLLAEPVGVGG
ncbi:MAG: CopG family transcriptional regulator [Actinomycetota bacterium]